MKLSRDILLTNSNEELKKAQLQLIRKIPREAFKPQSWKSWSYLGFDFAVVIALAFLGTHAWTTSNIPLALLYLFLQSSFFVSIFVVGHDSGHESFSSRSWENALSGYLAHSFLLVPFYSWKLSHHKHHTYHHCLEKDESYIPKRVSWIVQYENDMANASRFKVMKLSLLGLMDKCCLTFIIYLFSASPLGYRQSYSHFDPRAELFDGKRKHILLSLFCVSIMLSALVVLASQTSVLFVLFLYGLPWVFHNVCIFIVTYLQHTTEDNYWFYKKDWHFFKGALQTVDYDYGKYLGPIINFFHHNIERYHFVHHLNLKIPHYRLKMAHEAIYSDIEDVLITKSNPIRQLIKYKYKDRIRSVKDYEEGVTHYRREALDTSTHKPPLEKEEVAQAG